MSNDAGTRPYGLQEMIRTHLWFALTGFCLGLIAAFMLVSYGPEFTQASPFFTFLAVVLVSTIAGAMTAGFVALTSFQPAEVQRQGSA